MKFFSLVFTLLISYTLTAQNEKPERETFDLKVAVDSVNFYQESVKVSPYFIYDKTIQIYPSEKLFIEVEIKKDTIASMKVVKKNLNPKKTIELDFIQNVNGRNHESMFLTVKNPFNKNLRYDALMYVLGNKDWVETSIIPVRAKLQSIEMWNDIILSIVLTNWRFE